MRTSSVLLLSLFAVAGHAPAAPAYVGREDCRVELVHPAPEDNTVSWKGACKDGYAEGKGSLEWRAVKANWKLEGTMARGIIVGEAQRVSGGETYIGSFRNGTPHGNGYFKTASGDQYEGGVVDGKPEGAGVMVEKDRSTYEGQWAKGQREGQGKAVFALGGSYDGQWRNGRFHGKGKITYAGSGKVYEGEFANGHASGSAPAVGETGSYELKADGPALGSHLRPSRAISFLPLDATWQKLTPEQREVVRSFYPALEDGDEPPYPAKGTRAFFKAVADVYQHFTRFEGDALLYVTVGADGVPKTVQAFGAPDPELGRYLSLVAMAQRFKPAMCRGQACEMIYPVHFSLTAE